MRTRFPQSLALWDIVHFKCRSRTKCRKACELERTGKPLGVVLPVINAGHSPDPGIALALAEEIGLQGMVNTSLLFFFFSAGEAKGDAFSYASPRKTTGQRPADVNSLICH